MILALVIFSVFYLPYSSTSSTSDRNLNSDLFNYRHSFSDIDTREVLMEGKSYTCIETGDLSATGESGEPQLYMKSFIFVVPPDGDYSVDISLYGWRSYDLEHPVLPVPQWIGEELVYEINDEAYRGRKPGVEWEITGPYRLGYWQVIRIDVYPIIIEGSELKVAGGVDVKLNFGSYNSLSVGSDIWKRLIDGLVINSAYIDRFTVDVSGSMDYGIYDYHPWYRISMLEDGIYEVTGVDLEGAGIDLTAIEPRTLRMLTGRIEAISWDVNDTIYDSFPIEVPLLVYDGGDGSFDSDDRIVFYGQSVTGYERNSFPGVTLLYHSPWSDTGVYWLTWGGVDGERMDSISSLSTIGAYFQTTFTDTVHIEKDSLNPSQSGLKWIQRKIARIAEIPSISYNVPFSIYGVYGDVLVNTYLFTSLADSHHVRIKINGFEIGIENWFGIYEDQPRKLSFYASENILNNGQNILEIELFSGSSNSDDMVLYDFSDMIYQSVFSAVNERIEFSVEDYTSDTLFGFTIKGIITENCEAFCIYPESVYKDNYLAVHQIRKIVNYHTGADSISFALQLQDSTKISISSNLLKPIDIRSSDPNNLKRITGADYIIISDEIFRNTVIEFIEFREKHFPGGLKPQIEFVSLDEIYDNFGYGMSDPASIRNYLKWTYDNYNPIPAYVLLLGAGNYDYRNIENSNIKCNIVPVHEEGGKVTENTFLNFNDCVDDWFVQFDTFPNLNMVIGRITVSNTIQAKEILKKIILYEQNNAFGVWKGRLILLADDEYGSRIHQNYNENQHTRDMEYIASSFPMYYQPVRLYLMNYPGTNQSAGPPYDYNPGEKPAAEEELMEQLDRGALFWVFLGHGSVSLLTHENVYTHPSNTNALENHVRMPVAFFGSCGVGAFDRINQSSLTDGLQNKENGGAIFAWGHSRESYPEPNKILITNLIDKILNDNLTPGEAAWAVKNYNDRSHRLYISFGDPASIVLRDSLTVSLQLYEDSVGVTKETGADIVSREEYEGSNTSRAVSGEALVDTVYGRDRYILQGDIDNFGDGWAGVMVVPPEKPDSHDYIHRNTPLPGDFLHYASGQYIPGLPVYEGLVSVSSGKFSISFTTPTGVIKSDTSSDIRDFMIYVYAWNDEREARGYLELPSSGMDVSVTGDSMSPEVVILTGGRILSDSGDVVTNPMRCEIVIEDISGVNLTPEPEYVMVLQVDGGDLDTMLSRDFVYDVGSSTRGRVETEINFGDQSGEHELLFVVSDNVGNRGYYRWYFTVEDAIRGDITHVMNYPNPMTESTDFTFILTSGEASVRIEIYTVAGRKIVGLPVVEVIDGFNNILWNGRDEEGDIPSNGVYFYRIVADWRDPESPGSGREIIKYGKLFIVR